MQKFVTFDYFGFREEIRKALQRAAIQISKGAAERAKINISRIPFKSQSLPGIKLSDAERKRAVLNSITTNMSKAVTGKVRATAKRRVEATVTALEKDFKDSHIGLYYEHGTGTKWDGVPTPDFAKFKNPDRHGREIVTRSKFKTYNAGMAGAWYDIGGNRHITWSRKEGRPIRNINVNTPAYHWFQKAVAETEQLLKWYVIDELSKVNILKFIRFRLTDGKKIVLGRQR
jgi:hypothetical protein